METIMQETVKENDIISWFAGFFDAEGCARIKRCVRKGGYTTYTPCIIINNTDLETIDFCDVFLRNRDINTYVRTSKPTTNRKPTKYVEVNRITKIIDFCNLLLPYSINKHDELLLLKQFCESRQERFISCGSKNKQVPYNEFEISLYNKNKEYKAHKKGKACLSYVPMFINTSNTITNSWLAGYIDGDGSFCVNKRGSASFDVSTTNPTTANLLSEFFISNNISYYYYSRLPGVNHLQCCKLRIHKYFVHDTSDINKVIRMVRKYLVSKFDISEVMYEYCSLRNENKHKNRTDYELELGYKIRSMTL